MGGNFIRFFPLISSQSSLSLDVENERKSERDARARDGDDAISVRALLFFVFLDRESARALHVEKFVSFFLLVFYLFVFFFKTKIAYDLGVCPVVSEICIIDSNTLLTILVSIIKIKVRLFANIL